VETRLMRHQYLLRRPRALQYSFRSRVISVGDEARHIAVPSGLNAADDNDEGEGPARIIVQYTGEGIAKHRERLDLFIDLIWVGIIGNLSEVFSLLFFKNDHSAGEATLVFFIVFLPSWRIWNFLREFLNNYYMDDAIQRVFVFWILILSVFFGNNIAYLPEEWENVKTILVTIYLIIRASFLFAELVYSIWIPWLRRLIMFNFLSALPSTGLWIACIYVNGVGAVGPAIAAALLEYLHPLILDSQIGSKLTPSEYRKEMDPDHFRTRMANFFIITVGEGVLVLIKGGPLGIGVSSAFTLSIWSLLIYFLLSYLYFNRDQSVRYIPAIRHKGWRTLLWVSWHIPLFASFITLSAGMLFLITKAADNPQDAKGIPIAGDELEMFTLRAIWNLAISVSVIMLSMTCQALLDKPLDPPGTLLVDNRYLRLAARIIYIIVVMCLPVKKNITEGAFLAVCGIGLSCVMAYEWTVSLEMPAKMLEPKGLTLLIKEMSHRR